MKYIVFFISLSCVTCLHSQKNTINHNENFYSLSVGYKTDTKWMKDIVGKYHLNKNLSIGNAWLKAEHKINSKLAAGLEIGMGNFSDEPGPFSLDGISASIYHIRILPSIRYNLFQKNKVTIYSSAGIGYYRVNYKINHLYYTYVGYLDQIWVTENIADNIKSGFDWTATIGALIYIRKTFGIVTELGANKSIGSIGVFIKPGIKKINKL